ncbi:MarR family transcriptional regulator [Deinococcus metallilatus]|uniref:MarR family transcriptional regulator n=1 Tax=Deinococcus metallilatus TaxID=1211322 RepID=A0AAJ5F1Y8_9DEIO|nr:helix-turn-helix domain-containing protein [Deinococcus metallilatus]MBB5296460.1 DNA-binding MarR family transcriptional regulator [Deinococcus metallilatus]QBY09871.1 MarR family transcriptional regulator [Deinococcus metallilatus]RXJ08595.1 MarR family transcriptional regulator [Deinococcus metallilatus]TLK25069.1 MarR family transcriptional regulator [Deinococcus metallilatus]GMA14627.1 hypothetical protein GCM10025871_09580 [Deinococcus metallilatus]
MDAGQLHRLARHLRELAVQATSASGEGLPSLSELAVVEDVAHHPHTSISEIARRVKLAQSLVSKTVAHLRDEGIFITTPDPSDGRRVQVSLAPEVRRDLQTRGAVPLEATLKRTHPELSAAQVGRVTDLLEEIARLLLPSRKEGG